MRPAGDSLQGLLKQQLHSSNGSAWASFLRILGEEPQAKAPGKTLSKIFEALKRAELASTKNSDTHDTRQLERRRTPRVRVDIPLLVYGYKGKSPFHEDACAVEVNAHGGLISTQTALRPRQKLLVVNKGNESKQRCTVLSVRVRQECGFDVAFEFLDPTPQFWQEQDLETNGSSPFEH